MKQLFFLALIMLIGCQVASSQSSGEKLESFRTNVLPQYNTYFKRADLTPGGQLKLSAQENYWSLTRDEKKNFMDRFARAWQESLILVQLGTKSELWVWNTDPGEALLLDTWDISRKTVTNMPAPSGSKTALHPWFIYFGGQEQLDSQKNINLGLNARVGFFLLMNRWDLAATFSGFMMGNIESDEMTTQSSTGLMSKVYFPIKKYRISPNIGTELSWSSYSVSNNKTSSLTPFLLTGISWYVGTGSLDIGIKTGKESVFMIGYTYIPRMKLKKQ